MMHASTGRFSPRARSWLGAALRRAAWTPLAIALMLPVAGCDKPKEADCRKAITNIRKLYGTADNDFGVSPESMVHACQGSASPESVRCFIQAKSVEELQKCEGDTFKEMFEAEEQKRQDGEGQKDTAAGDQGAPGQPGQGSNP